MESEEFLSYSRSAADIDENEKNLDEPFTVEEDPGWPRLLKNAFGKKRYFIPASLIVSFIALLLFTLSLIQRRKTGELGIQPVTAQLQDLVISALTEKSDESELPTLEEADESRPVLTKKAKEYLSNAVKEKALMRPTPADAEDSPVVKSVAKCISGGNVERLTGLKFRVINVQGLSEPFAADHEKKFMDLQAVGLLGYGPEHVIMEVFDVETRKHFAIKLCYKLSYEREPLEAKERAENLKKEIELMQVAAGGGVHTPDGRRVTTGIGVADIEDSFPVSRHSFYSVFGRALIMDKRECSFRELLNVAGPLPLHVKRYIAGRLLLSVLHLQEAGISHNALKWGSLLIDVDGSLYIGDFGKSTAFGDAVKKTSPEVKDLYKDPQLVVDFNSFISGGEVQPVPDAKSDLWSLGCMLYELFSDGKLPFMENPSGRLFQSSGERAQYLLNENIEAKSLLPDMQKMGIPRDWRTVIVQLLEPKREKRIGAKDLATKYRSLFTK